MKLTPLAALSADVDPWERQPGETTRRHAQFLTYRDLGRARTLQQASEGLALAAGHVRAVGAAFRWRERAEAWDRHRDQLDQAAWLEARREAARNDARILNAMISKVAAALVNLDPATLTPAVLVRMVDVAMRHRRALFGDPMATIAVTSPAGDALAAQLAEFTALPTEQRTARLAALAAEVLRRTRAIEDTDEDDEDDGEEGSGSAFALTS